MAETLLWRVMQRHDLRMLATYATFLMEKGVDLQDKIATTRARQA